jgi:hypothetical protein
MDLLNWLWLRIHVGLELTFGDFIIRAICVAINAGFCNHVGRIVIEREEQKKYEVTQAVHSGTSQVAQSCVGISRIAQPSCSLSVPSRTTHGENSSMYFSN